MNSNPCLDAYRLEVLADRLTLKETLEEDGGGAKQSVLAHALLGRHPELGDRVAREIVSSAYEERSCCLQGLEQLADHLIEWRGGEILLRSDTALRQPRSMLDEDQLVAAMAAQRGHLRGTAYTPIDPWLLLAEPVPSALDRDLEDLLERPLAETHIHLGGAAPPATFWLPLVLGLLSIDFAGAMAAEASAFEVGEVRSARELTDRWICRLLEASALRWRLAAQLASGVGPQHPFRRVRGLLQEECPSEPCPGDREVLPWLKEFRLVLDRIGTDSETEPAASWGCRIQQDPGSPIPYRDCLSRAVELELKEPCELPPGLGERYLLASGLRYLRSSNGLRDEAFRATLLRYVRIKTALLRLLVHFPGIHGLDRFRNRFARRRRGMRRTSSGRSRTVWLAASFRYQVRTTVLRWLAASTHQHILPRPRTTDSKVVQAERLVRASSRRLERRLELRLGPTRGPIYGRMLLAFAKGLRDALEILRRSGPLPALQTGLVFHLHKDKNRTPAAYEEILWGVLRWLDDRPSWRPLVLGVDVAGSELDAPPSRFSLAYRTVERWRSRGVAGSHGMPPEIGKTFHVGEDFRDLLTGVRQVDLALDLLGLRAGDRLGHALAVGLEPELWYRRRGRSFPRRGDHLLDLLWARRRLRKLKDGHRLADAANVRIQALGVGQPQKLEQQLEQQFGAWFDHMGSDQAASAETERELQERLLGGSPDELTEVQPDERWLEMLCQLQRTVVRRIDRKGLFIEANPTSNLQIAGLNDFTELPIFRLHPIRTAAGRGGPEARLSVSTDDPETFRVNLREEYAALFQAADRQASMNLEGEVPSRREILDWLDRLRSDSFESSFLRQSSPSAYDLLRYLRLLTT